MIAPPVGQSGVPVDLPPELVAAVRESPVLVGGGFVLAVVILIVAVVIGRRYRRSSTAAFKRALAQRDAVAVLMHPNPDPDAMASAMAVARLAETVDTEATLQYPGEIRHQENRAFETVLGLDLERITSTADLAAEAVVLVDHCEPRGFDGAESVFPYAVIDHHPDDATAETFSDVRPDAGACASILADYCRREDLSPVGPGATAGPDDLATELATGLLYGIQSDTKQLTRGCTDLEFSVSSYLADGIDPDLLDRIANPQVSADVLETKARAIADREVRGTFAVSHVGAVDNVDGIPQAADELLRLEGVSAVVVTGEHDGTLHVSGRSLDDRVHMGKCLSAALDEFPTGSAGGHARMGGGRLPLDEVGALAGARIGERADRVAAGSGTGTVAAADLTEELFDALSGAR